MAKESNELDDNLISYQTETSGAFDNFHRALQQKASLTGWIIYKCGKRGDDKGLELGASLLRSILEVLQQTNTQRALLSDPETALFDHLKAPTLSEEIKDILAKKVIDVPSAEMILDEPRVLSNTSRSTNQVVRKDELGRVIRIRDISGEKQLSILQAMFAPDNLASDFKYPVFEDAIDAVYADRLDRFTGSKRKGERLLCEICGNATYKSVSERLKTLEELEVPGELHPETIPTRLRQFINSIQNSYSNASFTNIRRAFERDGITFADLQPVQPGSNETIVTVTIEKPARTKRTYTTKEERAVLENKYQLSRPEIYFLGKLLISEEVNETGIVLNDSLATAVRKIVKKYGPENDNSNLSEDAVNALCEKIGSFLDKEKRKEVFLANQKNRQAQIVLLPLIDADPQKIKQLLQALSN